MKGLNIYRKLENTCTRMRLSFIILSSLFSNILGQIYDPNDSVCACTQCCNVLNSTTFTGADIKQFTFPLTSFDGSYTLVDFGTHDNGARRRMLQGGRDLAVINGTPYKHVVRYLKEDGTGQLLYNPQLFASSGTVDCTQSHVYWRVQVNEDVSAGVTYTAGDLMQIPLVQSQSGTYCMMNETAGVFDDGSGIGLSMKMLENPDEVYFAFNGLVHEGSDYFIQFTRTEQFLLSPVDSSIQYQYKIRDNSVVVTEEESNGEFFIRIVFDVQDIETDVEPDPSCHLLDDVVIAHGYFGTADGSVSCPVVLDPAFTPTGDKDVGNGRTYTLKLSQSQYEDCAESLSVVNDDLVFDTTLRFLTGAIGQNCFYFQPGSSQQAISITMDADITDETSATAGLFSTEIVSVVPERCTPYSTYPEPMARVKVAINVTFVETAGGSVSRITASIPTFSSSPINLVPDSLSGADSFICTSTVTADGTFKECTYYFVSDACERVYTTQNGECAFEYDELRLIENLVFQENYAGGYYVIRRSEPLDTMLQSATYPLPLCQAKDEADPIDVSDTYNSTLSLQNYYDNESVNWGNTTGVNFNDKMILRLAVGEAAAATFDNIELFIKSVTVTLRNPSTSAFINSFTYNVEEKKNLMSEAWTFFYTDPVFCSYYNSLGGNGDPEDKCQPFFDPFSDGTTRWNGHNSGGDMPQALIDSICQRGTVGDPLVDSRNVVDNRNIDHFAFDPSIWFADNVNAFLEVEFQVSGVIHKCGANETITTRRALSEGRDLQGPLDPSSQVLYVSQDITITIGGENNTEIEVVIKDPKDSDLLNNTWFVVLLVTTIALFLIIAASYVGRDKKAHHILLSRINYKWP